jgi:DNA-binding SARP family transcriptional activator
VREPLSDGIGSFGSGEEPKLPLLQVYTFGEFAMQWRAPSAGDEDAWKSRTSARSLLLLLLCAPNRQATRSQLTGILWPETDEAKARESLRSASKVLRRVVCTVSLEGLLETRHNGDILKLADQARLWVDVDAFETLVQQASRETELRQALVLWQEARQM